MLVYWYVGMLVCRYVGMSVCRYVGMSVCWYVGMSVLGVEANPILNGSDKDQILEKQFFGGRGYRNHHTSPT